MTAAVLGEGDAALGQLCEEVGVGSLGEVRYTNRFRGRRQAEVEVASFTDLHFREVVAFVASRIDQSRSLRLNLAGVVFDHEGDFPLGHVRVLGHELLTQLGFAELACTFGDKAGVAVDDCGYDDCVHVCCVFSVG